MTTSIKKSTKSFFVKLLVGIIILPFVFWGMGDVFRGGNQNVIATIESKKLSTQEFMNYLNRLNLNEKEMKELPKSNLLQKILSEYIGRKVMALEIAQSGITVSDKSLRDIIKNDKLFFKNKKFSRTEYEKFLLKSGLSAPAFEKNIVEQESRRQLLGYLGGGISVPDHLIEKAFKKENQIKTIKYIDLKNHYSRKKPSKERIKDLYEKNKEIFIEEFKSIQFAEVTPQTISGNKDYNETFFKQLDVLENKILDGQSFEQASKDNDLKIITINKINAKKFDSNKKKIEIISDALFKKIYSIGKQETPELIKIENKYFLAQVKSIQRNNKPMNDTDVLKAINAQLVFENTIKINTSILKDLSMGGFDKSKMEKFANNNSLPIKDYKISSLKQNEIFNEEFIKKIFSTKDKKIELITNSTFTKNFLILAVNTQFKKLDKKSNEFEQYEAKARLDLINQIYKIFDANLSKKYKVEINNRTIDRVKNSF